jgi:hypothetical protein
MKLTDFSINSTGTLSNPEFNISFWKRLRLNYFWKSPKTGNILITRDINCASKFKTREEAILVLEEFLNQ